MKKLDLGKDKISKLLLAFSIPCVVSMLINTVYNIVDQIFIGKGVGTLGNAATNVLFPLIILFNATSGLIGNGAAANMSLKLGEGKKEEAGKSVGQALTLITIVSITLSVIAYLSLPKLVYLFGCSENVYPYALDYGRIILLGAPFMVCYSSISSIIRADGAPKYSMVMLVIGAIINIILDPIFIFGFNLGVKGGAYATIIGQMVSFIIAIIYIPRLKSIKIEKKDFKLDGNVFRVMGLGLSSFITQCTILVLFVFMNNMMTKYGALSKFGPDIPLSVYGVVSKLNSIFISTVIGISIGAQPIVGFNYGAGNKERVKETLKKLLLVNFLIGIAINIMFVLIPKQLIGLFITPTDPNYDLFLEFGIMTFRTFLVICSINALEMTTSIVLQSLGKVVKSTAVSFTRQIILFIPLACLFSIVLDMGIKGVLYAGPCADFLCFIFCIFIFTSEYKKLKIEKDEEEELGEYKNYKYNGPKVVVTISREYGSGGRYVGELLAKELGVNFYDKEIISLAAKESGLSKKYIKDNEQKMASSKYANNNDDRLFIAEEKVIKKLAKEESCVIVGRCADYILKDNKDVIKVFLYSSLKNEINRAVKYYDVDKQKAEKIIIKKNKERSKHYKYYTNREWKDFSNYDIALNVDEYGVEETATLLKDIVIKKSNK